MTKLKRFIIITVSLLALIPLYKIVQACADGGDPYDEYPSFFPPDITAKPVYTPYFYQSYLKYYDDWYEPPVVDKLPDGNIEEWYGYSNKEVRKADLDRFIYKYSYSDLKTLYFHVEKGESLNLNSIVANNAFTKRFIKTKDLEALGYLMYAKQCEPFAVNNDWETPVRDTAKMGRLIKNGLQLFAAAKKDFFKDKFAFQSIRMAFYASKNQQVLDLFNTMIGERNAGGYAYARCLELKAGALYRLKRKPEAAYVYSKVFDLNDNFKTSSYLSFDWAVGHDVSSVLKLCKTPHEHAVVQVMDGLHNYEYGLPNMQAAYEADPQVAGLDVLMTREINKIEERYQQPTLYRQRNVEASSYYYNNSIAKPASEEYNKQQADKAKYEKYMRLLNAFAQKLSEDGKRTDKAFWRLSSAYLYFMQGDVAAYNNQLATVKESKMSNKERDLYDVLQVLYIVRNNKELTPAVEAQLLPQLKALKKRSNAKAYRDVMNTLITTAYLQQHDTIKAIFTLGKVSSYQDESFTDLPGSLFERMTPKRLEEVIAFVQKNNKSEYDRWLLDSTLYTIDRLTELEGTKYLRMHQFATAASLFKKVSPALLAKTQLPNPFVAHISDRYELDGTDTGKWYTKLSYAEAMVALEGKMAADAGAQFDYGVGLYSMTYYGKATYAYTYYRSSMDDLAYFNTEARKTKTQEAQEYYSALKAEQTFVKAAALATEPSLKAKSLFMAARCWQKRCPGKENGYYSEENQKTYYANSLNNPYFKQLKDGFASTPFYTRAISTCGYFGDYVKQVK